jgi:hypothetical protein
LDAVFYFGADRECYKKDFEPSFCFLFGKFQNPGSGLDGAAATMGDFAGVQLKVWEDMTFLTEMFYDVTVVEFLAGVSIRVDSEDPSGWCDVCRADFDCYVELSRNA